MGLHGDPGGAGGLPCGEDRETELIARIAELEQALRVRDDFLSIAAHELRNPMHSLLLQVSAAVQIAHQQGSPSLVQRLERVRQIVDRYVKRATLLLDVARMNATHQKLNLEEADLPEIVREVVESYTPEADFHQAPLLLEAPESLPGRWDRLGVEQIVSNLVSNAIKFGAGAPIGVTVTHGPAQTVVLQVRDGGVGIAPEDQNRIFGRFEQLRPPGARASGAGVGLWLVRELVHAHGGEIAVTSAPGQGATFTVKLPIDAAVGDEPNDE